MKLRFSSRGMSLTEIMVVLGILGFMGLAISSAFTDVFKIQNKVVNSDEANEFASSMGRFFFNESSCTEALKGKVFPVSGTLNLSLPNYVGYGSGMKPGAAVSAGTLIGTKVRIRVLSLINKGMPVDSIAYNGAKFDQYLAQVQVAVDLKNGQDWDQKPVRSFEFPVLVKPATKVIEKCMSGSSMEDSCVAMGSTFNPTTGTCTPASQCFFEGMFVENKCDGSTSCTPTPAMCPDGTPIGSPGTVCPANGQCKVMGKTVACLEAEPCPPDPSGCPPNTPNEITGGLSCPTAKTRKQTGGYTWSFVVSCGKKCSQTINVETKYFICLKCN